jgi:hypothetical protein
VQSFVDKWDKNLSDAEKTPGIHKFCEYERLNDCPHDQVCSVSLSLSLSLSLCVCVCVCVCMRSANTQLST